MDMGQRRLIEKHRVSYLVITGLQELHHELNRYLGLSDSFDLHRSWFLRLWVVHYILLLPCWQMLMPPHSLHTHLSLPC